MHCDYIDRVDETQYIIDLLTSAHRPLVIMIGAPSGIGKSTLAKKTLSILRSHIECVRVQTPQINSSQDMDQATFLREVFLKLCERYSSDRVLSFHSYVIGIKDPAARKRTFSAILEIIFQGKLKKQLSMLSKMALKRMMKIEEFDYKILAYHQDVKTFQVMNEYVSFVLAQKQHLINIDGLQNIDKPSKKCLVQWIRHAAKSNSAFLLEYTTPLDEDGSCIEALCDELNEDQGTVVSMRLDSLSFEHALETVSINDASKDLGNVIEAEEYYRNSACGNIRKLKDFFLNRQFPQNRQYHKAREFDPTEALISQLSADEKSVLCVILLHKGSVPVHSIERILSSAMSVTRLHQCLSKLGEDMMGYVSVEGKACVIDHPSILDSLSKAMARQKGIRYAVYNLTATYYKNILNQETVQSRKDSASLMLMQLYYEFDRKSMIKMLPYIERLAINGIDVDQAIRYSMCIIDTIDKDKTPGTEVCYRIIDLFISLDRHQEAYDLLLKIQSCPLRNRFIFYQCHLLIALERYADAIKYIDSTFSEASDIALGTYLIMFKIIALKLQFRSTPVDDLTKTAKLRIASSGNLAQEGYLKKISEISMPRTDAVADLRQSVACFDRLGLDEQIAKSELSLGFLYAIQGEYSEALASYEHAEGILRGKGQYRHIFCVNNAAVLLLQSDYGQETWRLLEEADLTAQSNTSCISILINKMAYCLAKKDYKTGSSIAVSLKKMTSCEIDSQFKAIAFYNLFLYYQESSASRADAEDARAEAFRLSSECNTVRCRFEHTKPQDGTASLLAHPWHVCFLSFMNIDYTETEESLSTAISINSSTIPR